MESIPIELHTMESFSPLSPSSLLVEARRMKFSIIEFITVESLSMRYCTVYCTYIVTEIIMMWRIPCRQLHSRSVDYTKGVHYQRSSLPKEFTATGVYYQRSGYYLQVHYQRSSFPSVQNKRKLIYRELYIMYSVYQYYLLGTLCILCIHILFDIKPALIFFFFDLS